MSVRAPAVALLLVACAPAPRPGAPDPDARPAAPGRQDADARPLPAELAGLVEPWHAFDPSLADASPVWLLTRYQPGNYPCVPRPGGALAMIRQDRFAVETVLRGSAAAPGVDLDLHALRGAPAPRAFAGGRRYLLLLRPGPEAQARLADPHGLGRIDQRLGPPDVAQVIDLDQTRAEAEAEAVVAVNSREHRGYLFDPVVWDSLRSAARVEPDRQRSLAEFLQTVVLRPQAPLAEVRAWLGAPDVQQFGPGLARRDQYILGRPVFDTPADGEFYGDLRLRYDDTLRLVGAELTYLSWRVRPDEQASVALTLEQHGAHGLPQFAMRWD